MASPDEIDAAWGLLFLNATERPPLTPSERAADNAYERKRLRAIRELEKINDWNGANRRPRGTSGIITLGAAALRGDRQLRASHSTALRKDGTEGPR